MSRQVSAVIFAALIGCLAPVPAFADGFFSPWAGVNFANEPADGRGVFGLTGGSMAGGVIGAELDFGYSPNFFGEESVFGNNNVLTLMGNLIVGIPLGGSAGPGVRPYVTAGAGLLRSKIDVLAIDISDNDFGINAGGGVMLYFGDRLGVRGDLRYFRAGWGDFEFFDFEKVDFWRASVGLVVR
jgi:opacity protein-like surface antigen